MIKDIVYYQSSRNMANVENESVQLIITSPPYFNIKNYSDFKIEDQIGDISDYKNYIKSLTDIWIECFRVLKPNGKLVINTPHMPMFKKDMNTHHNRDILFIDSDIRSNILSETDFYLYDQYIWDKGHSSQLMFGSYPYPPNFYSRNTTEFITVYVKDGKPDKKLKEVKEKSKLTKEELHLYTEQIWKITPVISRKDHSAPYPEEIPKRLIKLFSFKDDIILDCFAGSGTTLKVAKELKRSFIGYEIDEQYKNIIEAKLNENWNYINQEPFEEE